MKNSAKILFIGLLIYFPTYVFSQDISIQNMIGKDQSEVIKSYGIPKHIDNSIPSMICLFYKNPEMVFVSDEHGIYQAELTLQYSTNEECKKYLDGFISNSLADGFSVDTLSAASFKLRKQIIETDLQMLSDNISEKYQIKIKSVKHEE